MNISNLSISTEIEYHTIDLKGAQGNVFYLMALTYHLGKELEYNQVYINKLIRRMMRLSYKKLVNEFDKEFGDYVVLLRN